MKKKTDMKKVKKVVAYLFACYLLGTGAWQVGVRFGWHGVLVMVAVTLFLGVE
jgi:hypothetical protein